MTYKAYLQYQNANQQRRRLNQNNPNLVSLKMGRAQGNVLFRTDTTAFATANALAAFHRLRIQFQANRTCSRAGTASLDAVFSIAFQHSRRQNRKQAEDCTHRTQELTKEPLLHRHTTGNQCQQYNTDRHTRRNKITARQEGKYCPWAVSIDDALLSQYTQY